MEVIYNNSDNTIINKPTGVGLGNFDGLHIGHMALINTLINESKFDGLSSVIYTFTKHPENILRKKLFTPLLTTENKKIDILKETALDYIFFDEFDEKYSRLTPENFVKDILVNKLNIKLAVAGFHYRFGYKGQGDVKLLTELGKSYNFNVIVIPPIKADNEVVSSTSIRSNVLKGNMDKVFKLLGRHYSITGEVKAGKMIGRKIGFPTANIHPENYLVLPQEGVYITKTLLDNKLYQSVTNIGKNPTFGALDTMSVETHILDFEGDIYNKNIEVFLVSKIRGEKKFAHKDELIAQIQNDITTARKFFSSNNNK